MKKIYSALLLLTLSLHTFAGSWQGYVEEQLVGSGFCKAAAIFDFSGRTYALKNMRLNPQETNEIMIFYSNSAAAFALGLTVQETHYSTKRANSSTLAGTNAQEFVWISKTHTVSVVSRGDLRDIGQGASVTEKLAEYLRDNGV